MRALALAAAVLLAACQTPPPAVPTPTPTRDPNALEVTVLLDLSGPDAALGSTQRAAMQAWSDRRTGTPRVRVGYVDVAGGEARLILALKRAVDERADAVVIGAHVRYGELVAQAVAAAALPVLFTLPIADPSGGPGARWAFALAPTADAVAEAVADDADARGLLGAALVLSDGAASGAAERLALLGALRRHGLVTAPLVIDPREGQRLVRVAAVAARSVFFPGTTAAYTAATSGVPPTTPATLYLSYLTTDADLLALRDAGTVVSWPGSRAAADAGVNTIAATAGDALAIVAAAYARAEAPVTGERLRLALETLTFSGVATRYTFAPDRRAGAALDDLALLRWSAAAGAYAVPAPRNER